MNNQTHRNSYFSFHILLLFGFSLIILFPVLPHLFPHPNIDQGVYTYIGQEILNGKIPYRDLWDHKGPIIYYIYALGILIDSKYGVWLVGAISLFVSVCLSYKFFFKLFGRTEALFGTLAWLFELQFILDGGNTIEFFNLPLLFGSLLSLYLWLSTKRIFPAAITGILGGLAFFLRPNEISILMSACLVCLYQAGRSPRNAGFWVTSLIYMIIGFGVVAATISFVIHSQGALVDFVDAVIHYNLLYTQSESGKLESLVVGAYLVAPLFIFSFATWLAFLMGKYKKSDVTSQEIIPFLTIALPTQIWLATLSNRLYPHYYISWLPLMSVMFVIGVRFLARPWLEKGRELKINYVLSFALLAMLMSFTVVKQWRSLSTMFTVLLKDRAIPAANLQFNPDQVYINHIAAHTTPTDTVWFWGNQVALNVQSDRKTPSRLLYPYPLSTPDYATPQLIQATINELKSNPPALIVDASADIGMPSLNEKIWREDQIVWPLIAYIQNHYHITDRIGPHRWAVWEKKPMDNGQ